MSETSQVIKGVSSTEHKHSKDGRGGGGSGEEDEDGGHMSRGRAFCKISKIL